MNLTQFDIMLIEMINYLRYNNLHFNKVLVNFAINQDKKRQKETSAYLKKQTEIILRNTGAQIQNNNLYDALYVISIAKADFQDLMLLQIMLQLNLLRIIWMMKMIMTVLPLIDSYPITQEKVSL